MITIKKKKELKDYIKKDYKGRNIFVSFYKTGKWKLTDNDDYYRGVNFVVSRAWLIGKTWEVMRRRSVTLNQAISAVFKDIEKRLNEYFKK